VPADDSALKQVRIVASPETGMRMGHIKTFHFGIRRTYIANYFFKIL